MQTGGQLQELMDLVRHSPRNHAAWHAIALIRVQEGRPQDALPAVERALALDRHNAEYLNTRGVVLAESGAHEEAMRSYRRAIKLRPSLANAHYNIGRLQLKSGRAAESLAALERARALAPEREDIRESIGMALWEAGRFGEAHGVFTQTAAALSHSALAARHQAMSAAPVEGLAAARALYERALVRFPADQGLRWSRARLLLATGEFAAGWREYLWRPMRHPRMLPAPGEPYAGIAAGVLAGKTVALVQEQGLGDVIFFSRYAPALKAHGCRLLLRCERKLHALLAPLRLYDEFVDENQSPPADVAMPIDDLPAILRADAVAPSLAMRPDAARAAAWRERLGRFGPPPYVALTWRAGSDNSALPEFGRAADLLSKQIGLGDLAPCLRGLRGSIVVVQRAPLAAELPQLEELLGKEALDLSAANEDLADMAALLSVLDDYVGVSNTNMHLAAAVGRVARVLLPYPAEWRWMADGPASPWFPGFRTYRQAPDRSWAGALSRLREEMQESLHAPA